MRTLLRRLMRQGQIGQSVVILALGMVGLLAFVGITTDISVLFVRYSALRRAVDAASIAAAGQMRQDRTIATVSLTARQYIEFHGINPRDVVVETCHNQPRHDFDPESPGIQLGVGETDDPELCTEDLRKLVRVTAQVESPTIFLRLIGFGNITLQASATSETAVLDVILIMDVSESMAIETTIYDWAQVGLARAYIPPRIQKYTGSRIRVVGDSNTGFISSDTVMGAMAADGILPTRVAGNDIHVDWRHSSLLPDGSKPIGSDGVGYDYWFEGWLWDGQLLSRSQEEVNRRLYYVGDPAMPATPRTGYEEERNQYYMVQSFVPNGITGEQNHPREQCRVRFHPFSVVLRVEPEVAEIYVTRGGNLTNSDWPNIQNWNNPSAEQARWSGFRPTFDFYGCCNDPSNATVDRFGNINATGSAQNDGYFDDLICQPMKQARDATRLFLERIDFLRGDRVGFVNYARSAFILDPDGRYGDPDTGENVTHMIETYALARATLDGHVGVLAEPNFYIWNENGGGWIDDNGITAYSQGVDRNTGEPVPIDYFDINAVGLHEYPVRGSCFMQNAALPYPFSLYATRNFGATLTGQPALINFMNPNLYPPTIPGQPTDPWAMLRDSLGLGVNNAYELWAGCRRSNTGAALREANNALTDPRTSRREGSVWIMIMLSDGAAGASDPVRSFGRKLDGPEPYAPQRVYDWTLGDTDPNNFGLYGIRGEYGYYGLCPMGVPDPNNPTGNLSVLGELILTYDDEGGIAFPYCSDEDPHTRHFCLPTVRARMGGDSSVGYPTFDPGFGPGARDQDYDMTMTVEENRAAGNIYDVDIGEYGAPGNSCDPLYDVDDYARDWADFITGIHDDVGDEAVLPTIFTIGFNLNFDRGDGSCEANLRACLGEELLRYIADVGENWQVNTHYQQDWLDDGILNNSVDDYGPKGPCEDEMAVYDGTLASIQMRPHGENCGNYYNAPGQSELDQVFDEIASRMFTRLAR